MFILFLRTESVLATFSLLTGEIVFIDFQNMSILHNFSMTTPWQIMDYQGEWAAAKKKCTDGSVRSSLAVKTVWLQYNN